jgi:hypothetical protein
MKALVYDVKTEEIIHLIQEAREDKAAYLGQHSPLSLTEIPTRRCPRRLGPHPDEALRHLRE